MSNVKDYNCPNDYCIKWGKFEYCRCRLSTISKSAATVQLCRIYRKIIEEQKDRTTHD